MWKSHTIQLSYDKGVQRVDRIFFFSGHLLLYVDKNIVVLIVITYKLYVLNKH